ncbi:MAG: SEC-C metal-binding domain-containing protein [Isosphaerales bacterium]
MSRIEGKRLPSLTSPSGLKRRFHASTRTTLDSGLSLQECVRRRPDPCRRPVCPVRRETEEVCHATQFRRRHALLSRSWPSDDGGILSEAHVKPGRRVVHGDKELHERLGRNDFCPCGSGRRFKRCCRNTGCFRRRSEGPLRTIEALREKGISPILQPIMPLNLPVKVRSWELTVYPRSHIRR